MLKDLVKEYQKSAAGLVEKMYGLADNLDAKGVGTKKWFPDKETREVLKLSLYTFFLYIATADRGISQEETDFINEVLASEYTTADYKLLADRSKVNGDEYANEVPVIFRAGVDLENITEEHIGIAKIMYDGFLMLGFACMLSDLHVTQSEYDRLLQYMKMIYTWLEENLNTPFEADEPQKVIQRYLDELAENDGGTRRAVIEPDEKPEKKSEIKSFMSYYLPTTLKLLRSYSTFERQGVGGENIDSAKKDIERILDTLVVGFTQQLDQLFKTDVLDISSDIEVLEQMMKKDGLSEADDFEGLTLGGV